MYQSKSTVLSLCFFCYDESEMKQYRPVAAIILKREIEGEQRYLLVRKPRKQHDWQFPQGGVDAGETAIQAAQRELREECGDELVFKFELENSVGAYQYDFPNNFQRHAPDVIGARVEFFVAQWQDGEAFVDGREIIEARWLNSLEIKVLVAPEYWKVVEGWL